MTVWISIIVVLFGFLLLARLDVRGPANLPVRSWNVFFGPKPRDGETQAGYTLRKAIAALITTVVVAIPLFFLSALPDEGANFTGNESTFELLVFIIFAPLATMSAFSVVGSVFGTLILAVFLIKIVF